MNQAAPIAMFVYKRAGHTRRMIESVLRNPLAAKSPIRVYCDGPRDEGEADGVRAARGVVREMLPLAHVVESGHNLGLANSVIAGVSDTIATHGRVVVVEDDLELSPVALDYFNEALERYRDEERVMHIAGYMYPVKRNLPDSFFCREATCYGWATWARAWRHFEPDGARIRKRVVEDGAQRQFNSGGVMDFFGMLENQIAGRTDSWAVRWYGSLWLRGGLALHPGRSLVRNLGFDGSGENSGASTAWAVEPRSDPVTRFPALIEEDPSAVRAMGLYRRRAAWQLRLESAQRTLRRWVS